MIDPAFYQFRTTTNINLFGLLRLSRFYFPLCCADPLGVQGKRVKLQGLSGLEVSYMSSF
jgi:hypothetical protein